MLKLMPITVELGPEQRRVDVVATGSLTQAERLAALARCIELLRAHHGATVLFDARAAVSAPTAAENREITEVVSAVASVFVSGVAIVLKPGAQYGMARMLQALLADRGVAVAVFTDITAAASWLGAHNV